MNDFLLFLLSVFNLTTNHKLVLWNPLHLFFILNSRTQGASLQLRICCRQLTEIVVMWSSFTWQHPKSWMLRRSVLVKSTDFLILIPDHTYTVLDVNTIWWRLDDRFSMKSAHWSTNKFIGLNMNVINFELFDWFLWCYIWLQDVTRQGQSWKQADS